VKTTRIRRGSL